MKREEEHDPGLVHGEPRAHAHDRVADFVAVVELVEGLGVDIDPANIIVAVGKGLSVVQQNMEDGLQNFEDSRFDVVIIAYSLQVLKRPHAFFRSPPAGVHGWRATFACADMACQKHVLQSWLEPTNHSPVLLSV